MSIAVRIEPERPAPAQGSESSMVRRVFPLSFAQSRLWILDRFQPGNPAYNLPVAIRLQGGIDASVLKRSIDEIVRRHEALRTTFEVRGGRPVQVVAPSLKIDLEAVDLRHVLRGSAKDNKVRQIIYEQGRRGFDLAKGPLLRVWLLRLDPIDSVLVVVMHHIVSDGWSMSVFYQELSALYMAFLNGQRSPLPELSIQYPDFSQWQASWLTGDVLEHQLQYWRIQLAGLRPVLDLPTDRPRPAVQSNRGDGHPFSIGRALCEELKVLSQSQGATLFMILIAAFKTLLHRLSDDTDIAVGTPIASRTQAELERLIGFFVNTLVLRTDLAGDPTFRDLLAREREVALGAYSHQDMPFEKLVEELQPERNLTHNPLFQILFAVQNIGVVDRNVQDVPPGPQAPAVGTGTAKFDLTMSLQDTGAGAQGFLEFNTDLFDAATAKMMLDRYHALLRAVAAQPDLRLSQLSLLTAAERTAVVSGWRGLEPEIPAAETILSLVRRHAHAAPSAEAAAFDGVNLGYAELHQRANQFARGLRRAGVAAGEAVMIAMAPGGDALVATLGTLAAGGVYVPIDPSELGEGPALIPGRLAELFADLGQVPVVVDETTAARVPAQGVRALSFRELAGAGQGKGSDEPVVEPSAAAIAAFVYQSTPDGGLRRVPLTHRALCRAAAHPAIQLQSSDRVAHLSHAASNRTRLEIFGTLAAGGTIVSMGDEHRASPRKLATALRDLRITVLFASPASTQRLAREFPWALRTVRLLLTDEPAAWRLREDLKPQVLERMLVLSGDAEAGGYFAVQPLAAIPPGATRVLVGEPAAGVTLLVLGANGDPAPAGVPGELCVETDLPPSGRPGPVLYRTGDMARQLADGTLEYRGRRDGRLLLEGLPLHPAAIETRLAGHAGVREAGVGVRRREGGRDAGLAALVVADGDRVVAEDLRAFLSTRLPAFMIPSAFYFVEALSRTRDGSLDRRALADEIAALDDPKTGAEPYLAPRTDIETTLAQIWMETLGTDRVGVKDHFFRLGGHSLLASQVVARISDAFDVEFPLQRLFEAPTVEQLARTLEPLAGAHRTPQVQAITPVPRDRPLPLSFAQQRLWFLDQFEPNSAFYNIAMPVRMAAAIDSGALQAAFNDLIARHETLRTTFAMADGQPAQVISKSYRFSMPVHDLRHFTEAERQAETQRLATLDARKPFDLKNGPVLRAELIRLDEADHVLLLTIHHIAADGWSTDILFRELMACYEARRTRRTVDLPALEIQYADFACWQRRWLTGTALDRQLAYWKRQLAGMPALFELPTDRPRPRIQTFSGGMYHVSLRTSLLEGVKRLSGREENTLFTTLLSAFKVLLYRYTGREDVVIGSPIANRVRPELEPLIGFFANTLVLRSRLSSSLTFRGVMERVHEVALEAYAHQDIPFEKLVEELHPERNLSYNPLFQVMFALQNTGRQSAAAAAGGAAPVIGANVAKFDLTMFVSDGADGGLRVGFEYNSDLFDTATIARFAEHYEVLLEAAVADPDQPIWTLPILSAAESVALAEWNETAAPFDRVCVHQLFEACAARAPEVEALVFDDRALSYGELNARANIWAHRLIDLGVTAGSCVAICMDRSVEMITKVIAVLKAGASYVPIDPKYPQDRIAFMLADSRAPVVLTQSHLADRLPAASTAVVVMDDDVPDATRTANPVIPLSADDLAYVIYTSGSTGRPKGVAMPHAPLSNLVQWQIARGPLPGGARTLQFASISFDVSFQEIFSTLCAGGSLVLVDEERRRDPAALWGLLRSERISRLFLPYVALQQLAEEAKHVTDLPATLAEVITAGEQLQITPQIAALFRRLSATLFNQYGPSESHVVTELEMAGTPATWPARPAIGRPLPNATIHVLDPFRQPCPIGAPGELHIGGDVLARGYIHRADLTAERFIPDNVGAIGGRLYRTGDRARYLADGTIEFLGRIDDQVKIRGFRVEPAEIEVLLRAHSGVQEAVVVAWRRGADEMQLIAYVQPDPAHAPSALQLRTYLGALLPDYMVPSAFVVKTALPLTPSGKLDRRALLDLQPAPPSAPAPKVVAQTPVEQALVRIWCDVLQLSQVGVHDNFFELGGHSLLATRVTSRVRDQFGVELPVRRMFEAPTIQSLALSVVELTLEAQSADEIARLLAEIEQMPDDEARTLVRGDPG